MSTTAAAAGDRAGLKFASGPGRWVLLATVLGSAIASIDATVVGIAQRAACPSPQTQIQYGHRVHHADWPAQ